MASTYTEDHLVEQPAIRLMQHELGWEVLNCYGEWDGVSAIRGAMGSGRWCWFRGCDRRSNG